MDSSAPPPALNHHQPPPHPSSVHQHHSPNINSYPFPNANSISDDNSMNNSSNTSTMIHQQNPPAFPFNDHHHLLQSFDLQTPSSGGGIEPTPKKKRGRPRKYSPDNSSTVGLAPPLSNQINDETPSAAKRNRGRPPGSVKRQMDALGAPGVGFTPHVITVNAGEDIASKIMAFSQQGPRTVCILSANGSICNVTLRQPAMSGGTVTYEGRFEIISLSGSFVLSESNGNRSRSGGLSVSFARSDGQVLGGSVAGMLKAASPVQVIVGSFIADGKKPKSEESPHMLNVGTGGSPSPGGGSSESGDEDNHDNSPPINRSSVMGSSYANNAGQHSLQNVPTVYSTMAWPNSIKMRPN